MPTPAEQQTLMEAAQAHSGEQAQSGSDNGMLQDLLQRPASFRHRMDGVLVAHVLEKSSRGQALLHIPYLNQRDVSATLICAPELIAPGMEVAIMFAQGNPDAPLILGPFLCQPKAPDVAVEVRCDDETQHLVLQAQQELELRCGEAAIILSADGQIEFRGNYITSHARSTQRIMGGSVNIN